LSSPAPAPGSVARAFAERGANIGLTARDAERLDPAAVEVVGAGGQTAFVGVGCVWLALPRAMPLIVRSSPAQAAR
jgi:hypothetical protein